MPNFAEKFPTTAQTLRLLKRDPEKYWKRILGLYITGILYFVTEKKFSNIGSLTRETYLFFRYIDDLLDGDIEVAGNPLAIINRIKTDIAQNRQLDAHPVAQMARHSLTKLNKLAKKGENPQQLFVQAIEAMVFDYHRRENRTTLTTAQLDDYYFNTFSHALNIMLIGFKSDLRVTKDTILSNLALCQGHIYSIRDLKDDWEIGIINIPKEILERAQLSSKDSYTTVIQNPEIQKWIANEISEYKKRVVQLQNYLKQSGEKFTYQAINFALLKHMLKAIEEIQ